MRIFSCENFFLHPDLIDSIRIQFLDVVQTFSMFGALILVAVKGTIDLPGGGVDYVISEAVRTSRIEPPM